MIRINLLPKKVSKKKAGLLQHLIVTGAALALVLVVIGYFWVNLNGRISDLRRQISVAEAEKEKLKDVNSQKKAYEENIAKLKNKLDIITQVKEGRYLPIRIFDDVTTVLDRDTPVWLTSFSYQGQQLTMDGFSLSNPHLASFVTELENTAFFQDVDLLFSEKVAKEDREIFRFQINAVPQKAGAPAPPAGRR